MDFLSIAKDRYTTKKYDSEKIISKEKIEKLKEILRLSPSSIDSQPWKFIFISDKKLKSELAKASFFNEHKVEDASHIVVFNVIDNLAFFEKQIKDNLPEGNVAYYNQHLKSKPESEIKAWMTNQVYLSLGFFLSACAALDIDSTPMEGIDIEKYSQILAQENYRPLFAVTIGYRDSEDSNQPTITPKSRLDLDDVIQTI